MKWIKIDATSKLPKDDVLAISGNGTMGMGQLIKRDFQHFVSLNNGFRYIDNIIAYTTCDSIFSDYKKETV